MSDAIEGVEVVRDGDTVTAFRTHVSAEREDGTRTSVVRTLSRPVSIVLGDTPTDEATEIGPSFLLRHVLLDEARIFFDAEDDAAFDEWYQEHYVAPFHVPEDVKLDAEEAMDNEDTDEPDPFGETEPLIDPEA